MKESKEVLEAELVIESPDVSFKEKETENLPAVAGGGDLVPPPPGSKTLVADFGGDGEKLPNSSSQKPDDKSTALPQAQSAEVDEQGLNLSSISDVEKAMSRGSDLEVKRDGARMALGGKTRELVEMLSQPEFKRSAFMQGLITFLPKGNKVDVDLSTVKRTDNEIKGALAGEILKGNVDTFSIITVAALYRDGLIEKTADDKFSLYKGANNELKKSLTPHEYEKIGLTINALNHVDFGAKSDSPELKQFDAMRNAMLDPDFKTNPDNIKDMQTIIEANGRVIGSSKTAFDNMKSGLDGGKNFGVLDKITSNKELEPMFKGNTLKNFSKSFASGIEKGQSTTRSMEAGIDGKAREKELEGYNKMLDKKQEKEMSKSRGKGSPQK